MKERQNHNNQVDFSSTFGKGCFENNTIAEVAGYYVSEAIFYKFDHPNDPFEELALYEIFFKLAKQSFEMCSEIEEMYLEAYKCDFELYTLPKLQRGANKIHPTDDIHTMYLYHWAIMKGYELYQEVRDNKELLLKMFYEMQFINEDFLAPDNLPFKLCYLLREEYYDIFGTMVFKSIELVESLLVYSRQNDAKQLFETRRSVCSYIFCLGRVAGNTATGQIDAETIIKNLDEYKPKMSKIIQGIGLRIEVNEFIAAHSAECSTYFILGILAENTRLELGLPDLWYNEPIKLQCERIFANMDEIAEMEEIETDKKEII